MSQEERIKFLYQKYIDRTCSDAELEELFDLLKSEENIHKVRSVLQNNWGSNNRVEELTTLDWDTFLKKTDQKKSNSNSSPLKKKHWMTPLSIAAGLLLIVGLAAWFWLHREVIVIYETGYGEVKEIQLNDNSYVRLNANSKMYWDENWAFRSHRKVQIEGEAFFDVAHLNGNQFLVETPDLTVQVTGTTFNVSNRREKTEVFLESGKVFLQLNPGTESDILAFDKKKLMKASLEMVPGDQFTYSSTTEEIVQHDNRTIEQVASWKTGSLIFKDIPLKVVFQELSDVYGKKFAVQDSSLLEKKIDAAYPYSDWKTVIKLMKLTINREMLETENVVTVK
ncbi:FecR family protein [Membranihabitans marinus]|uniref:FecR family protein n=1 Tax=Membranihabitans marinus TaxID=1227546 RepID=UPI001F44C182|nr:FecR domain-containing protein [Membranihabitans marinus]